MPDNVSISINGQSRVPPGFRFHPTEEELLQYYLRKKVGSQNIDLDVILEVDLNRLEPWDIQAKCEIGSTPQNEWYFFSHKDKKYPTGTRTNRATTAGFWKATGRDKIIYGSGRRIGMRKTLVFYKGRAPHGQKSDWIMHEYRLIDQNTSLNIKDMVSNSSTDVDIMGEMGQQEEGWVVCKIFKKKHHPNKSSSSSQEAAAAGRKSMIGSSSPNDCSIFTAAANSEPSSDNDHDHDEGALEQIFQQVIAPNQQKQQQPIIKYSSNDKILINNYNHHHRDQEEEEDKVEYCRKSNPTTAAATNNVYLSDNIDQYFKKLPSLQSPQNIKSTSSLNPLDLLISSSQDDDNRQLGFDYCSAVEAAKSSDGLSGWGTIDQLPATHLNGQHQHQQQQQHQPISSDVHNNMHVLGFGTAADPVVVDNLQQSIARSHCSTFSSSSISSNYSGYVHPAPSPSPASDSFFNGEMMDLWTIITRSSLLSSSSSSDLM